MTSKTRYALGFFGILFAATFSGADPQKKETDGPEFYAGAQILTFEDLSYPGIARMTRIEGIVIVKVDLDENGNVVELSLFRAQSHFLQTVSRM